MQICTSIFADGIAHAEQQVSGMADLRAETQRWVQSVLDQTGWDATTLARRAGLAPTTITRFLNSKSATHTLGARSLAKIVAATNVDLPPALGGSRLISEDRAGGVYRVQGPTPSPGPRDLPVLGHAKGGSEAIFWDNGTVQRYVERPWLLVGNPRAYAVHVADVSMEPVYRPGQLLYLDPTQPPTPGDDVVVQLSNDEAYVKRYVRRTAKEVICEQFNPPGEVRYAAGLVRSVDLVLVAVRVRT